MLYCDALCDENEIHSYIIKGFSDFYINVYNAEKVSGGLSSRKSCITEIYENPIFGKCSF